MPTEPAGHSQGQSTELAEVSEDTAAAADHDFGRRKGKKVGPRLRESTTLEAAAELDMGKHVAEAAAAAAVDN